MYFLLGVWNCLSGRSREGRRMYARAIARDPFALRSYLAFALSIFGRRPLAIALESALTRCSTPARQRLMTDPHRVLLMIDRLGRGGAAQVVVDLALGLDREKFEPWVCTNETHA